jgi:predicted acetyltransferase
VTDLTFREVEGDADLERYMAVEADSFGESAETLGAEGRAAKEHAVMRMALIGEEVVAGYALVSVGQFFGGASVPAQAVTSVFVQPAWRRRGVAGALLRDLVDVAQGLGTALAPLYASTTRLYRRFGWEACDRTLWCNVRAAELARLRGEGRARRDPDRGEVEAFRRGFLWRFDGPFDRPDWWLSVFWNADPKQEEHREYAWFEGDRITGHVTYRQSEVGDDVSLAVQDLVAETPDALRGILGFLGGHEAQLSHITFKRAAILIRELMYLLPDAHKVVTVEGSMCWMQRLIGLERAMCERGWASNVDARLELEVNDPVSGEPAPVMLEVANGKGALSSGGGRKIRCGIGALSAWYSSRLTAWEARRLSLMDAPDETVELMDALIDRRPTLEPDYF